MSPRAWFVVLCGVVLLLLSTVGCRAASPATDVGARAARGYAAPLEGERRPDPDTDPPRPCDTRCEAEDSGEDLSSIALWRTGSASTHQAAMSAATPTEAVPDLGPAPGYRRGPERPPRS